MEKKSSDEYLQWMIDKADQKERESVRDWLKKWISIAYQAVFLGVLAFLVFFTILHVSGDIQ